MGFCAYRMQYYHPITQVQLWQALVWAQGTAEAHFVIVIWRQQGSMELAAHIKWIWFILVTAPEGSNVEQKILPDEVFPLPEGVEWDFQDSVFKLDGTYICPTWSNSQQLYTAL